MEMVAQLVRASVCGAEGCGFGPRLFSFFTNESPNEMFAPNVALFLLFLNRKTAILFLNIQICLICFKCY